MKKKFDFALTRNPAACSLSALCVIAVGANTAMHGLTLGCVLAGIVLVGSLILSILRRMISEPGRIAAAILICAALAGIAQMIVARCCPETAEALGVFLPLCGVAAVLSGRCNGYACTHSVPASIWDAVRFGVPITFVITLTGAIREILACGTVFGAQVCFPRVLIAAYPVGGFVILGIVLGIVNAIRNRGKEVGK